MYSSKYRFSLLYTYPNKKASGNYVFMKSLESFPFALALFSILR